MVDAAPHIGNALLGKVKQRGYLRGDETQLDEHADVNLLFCEVMLRIIYFFIEIGMIF